MLCDAGNYYDGGGDDDVYMIMHLSKDDNPSRTYENLQNHTFPLNYDLFDNPVCKMMLFSDA